MLEKAYCYETNSVIPAKYACRKKHQLSIHDHYFCTFEGCNVLVQPKISEAGNYFFAAQPHGHHQNCDHYHPPKEISNIQGINHPRPLEQYEVFTPTALEPVTNDYIPRREMDFQPTPEQIAKMIQNAVIAIVPGTLEEVVNAWRNLDEIDRTNYPLLIGEHRLNYSDAFTNIFQSEQVVDVPWTGHIVWGFVNIKPGKFNGVYFLQTMKKFPLGNDSSAIHFTKKANLNIPFDFTNADVRSNIFWHGGVPVILKDRYVLEPPSHAYQFIHLAPVEGETRGQV